MVSHKKRFTDPLGSYLPALERNVLKHRAMGMLLVMFYAEELKHDVLDRIQTTDRLMGRLKKGASLERVPKGTKNPVDKALNALVADGAMTVSEKTEIVKLIDYRNIIAHQMHNLLLDLSPDRLARERIEYATKPLPKYNYNAVVRLRHFLDLLEGLYETHHYATTLRFDRMLFRSAERALLEEMKRLDRKISRLANVRRKKIESLNAELSLVGTEFTRDLHPQHPLNQYDDKRLTKRGVEICYRLFDLGMSTMAVAHLTGLSLVSARRRRQTWKNVGGKHRKKINIADIPHRKFRRRYDD